jgi:hypothetical protein
MVISVLAALASAGLAHGSNILVIPVTARFQLCNQFMICA